MNELVKQGKQKTLFISGIVLIAILSNFFLYHIYESSTGTLVIVWQVFRFVFTLSLLAEAFKGVNWAKTLTLVLCILSIIESIWTIFTLESSMLLKLPYVVFIFIYGIAFYHFSISKCYKALFEHKKSFNFDFE